MIMTQSPTRVDLSGGTLDCWPLHLFVGDTVTVNLSIDILTGVELEPNSRFQDDQSIEVEVEDLSYERTFSSLKEFLACEDPPLRLLQVVVSHFSPEMGFKLRSRSQSPVGAGLGGSSSLTVSLIKAFLAMSRQSLTTEQVVELAHNLEARVLNAPTGTQDYYPAVEPGLHLIHYTNSGRRLENLGEIGREFSEKMMLIYTGKAHNSGINNWHVIKSIIDGNQMMKGCLKEISRISIEMAGLARSRNWAQLPDLFDQEYKARTQLSPTFSSPEIEELRSLVLQQGAQAVKICGAGGGGSVLVWCDPDKQSAVKESCLKKGFQPLSAKPVRAIERSAPQQSAVEPSL